MDPHYYDMIIVDEFHHAAAKGYQKLLTWFHPKILLGLTATPERMDGKSILNYFGGHMAAEIRLPDAIERRLLCPFHYFGIDDPVSLANIKWTGGHYDIEELENVYTGEGALASQRARAIIQALERYTADMRDVKALGFCVSKNMPILWQTTSTGRASKPWPWMRTARRMFEMRPGRSWKAETSPSFS